MAKWAKCKECGGEVWFDAWADYDGNIVAAFDQRYCEGCDGEVGRNGYTVVDGYPSDD